MPFFSGFSAVCWPMPVSSHIYRQNIVHLRISHFYMPVALTSQLLENAFNRQDRQ
uniref:Uncharacterized protein n=1 Tax=Arundo donax TaxID=35708 RepID=A0A0A9ATZ6_ARUDO